MALGVVTASAQSLAPLSDAADAGTISANRPGFGDPPDVLDRGVVQLEVGVSAESAHGDNATSRTVTTPEPLIRVGLGRGFELEAASNGFVSTALADGSTTRRVSGQSDFGLALKSQVLHESRAGVTLAITGGVSMPTGRAEFSSGGYDPFLQAQWTRSLPASLVLGGSFGIASVTSEVRRFRQSDGSLNLSRNFGPWGVFVEAYGVSPSDFDTGTSWLTDGGLSRTVGRNVQLDVWTGHGLNGFASDWYVGFGFAVRRLPAAHRSPDVLVRDE